MENSQWGRLFLILGVACLIIGIGFYLVPRIPFLSRLGRLPGDVIWKRENITIYFPLVTSLLLSAVISLILIILSLLRR